MASTKKMIERKSLMVLLLALLVLPPSATPEPLLRERFHLFDEDGASTVAEAMLDDSWPLTKAAGTVVEAEEDEEERGERFLLKNSKLVVKSEGGEVRVMRGYYEKAMRQAAGPMHIGFVTMEPDTLYLPQYMDANLLIFVRKGEMKIGWIYKDEMVEKTLKIGDIYRIPAGSAFYIVNTNQGQRLQLICCIDTSENMGTDVFQSFFIAGGTNPISVLAGFDPNTLSTALNVTFDELRPMMESQEAGPIMFMRSSEKQIRRKLFMQLKQRQEEAGQGRKYWAEDEDDNNEEDSETVAWSWKKLLDFVLGKENKKDTAKAPDSYNLYERKPDFRNNYGRSLALDESDYAPLKDSGIGVYLVYLSAGSMMAPHLNPTATEVGIVLRGTGRIQIVYPNGTSAMDAEVTVGDVFLVPRYFPFCQIASRSGPLEFIGFASSARKNRPQFLVGASSLLRSMSGPEMAAAFDVSEETYRRITEAQVEKIILPARHPAEQQQQHHPRTKDGWSARKWATE
ncbi:hypothetical protein ACLOJK_022594 [Asimina triloba]